MPHFILLPMEDVIRITTIQSFLNWEDIQGNLQAFSEKFFNLTGESDLVVLPEMFTSGFSMNAQTLGEDMDGATMAWLKEQSRNIEALVLGSFIAKEGGKFYNRLVAMQPNGKFLTYDKKHLFAPGGEHLHYTAGNRQLTFNWQGWKIKPLICYDLRFPVWSRNTSRYDILIYIASWPNTRSEHWKQLLIARAIENQSYVIGVNRIGTDGNGLHHQGDTMVVDYAGKILYHAADREEVHTLELDRLKLSEYRNALPFLRDRDDFILL